MVGLLRDSCYLADASMVPHGVGRGECVRELVLQETVVCEVKVEHLEGRVGVGPGSELGTGDDFKQAVVKRQPVRVWQSSHDQSYRVDPHLDLPSWNHCVSKIFQVFTRASKLFL